VANYLGEAALGAGLNSRAAAQFAEALEIGNRAGAVPEQLRALAGLAAVAAAEGDRELAEDGLALVSADRAAHSEVRRLVRTAADRYGLAVREPTKERADVVARLHTIGAVAVATG
jgi:hypothetical protein